MWPGSQPVDSKPTGSPMRNFIHDNVTQSPPHSFSNTDIHRMHSGPGPKSPRSPGGGVLSGGSLSPRPTSPQRSGLSPIARPTNALHLHSIRSRLPAIIRALACRTHTGVVSPTPTSPGGLSIQSRVFPNELVMHKNDIDCLGLLIGGGLHLHRDEDQSSLSSMHSQWQNGNGADSKVSSDNDTDTDSMMYWSG